MRRSTKTTLEKVAKARARSGKHKKVRAKTPKKVERVDPQIKRLAEIKDYSPASTDFYALVDFHLITHVIEEKAEVRNYGVDTDLSRLTIYDAWQIRPWFTSFTGPEVDSRIGELINKNIVELMRRYDRKEVSLSDALGESKRTAPCQHTFGTIYGDIYDHPFLRRAFANRRNGRLLLRGIPLIGKFFSNPTEHQKRQREFNQQVNRTSETHRKLEEMLGNVPAARDELANFSVGYNIDLFFDLVEEHEVFTDNYGDMTFDGNKSEGESARYYNKIITHPRTAADLWRAIILRRTVERLNHGLGIYQKLEDSIAQEEFAALFFENTFEAEMKAAQKWDAAMPDESKMVPTLIANLQGDFDDHYETMIDLVDKELAKAALRGKVTERRLKGIVDVETEMNTFHSRYKKAAASRQPEFLFRTLSDTGLFRKRQAFLDKYGPQDDAERAFLFMQRHGDKLRNYIDTKKLHNWIELGEDTSFRRFMALPRRQKKLVSEVVNRDAYDGLVMLDFVDSYRRIVALAGSGIRFNDDLPSPEEVIARKDIGMMESYLDRVVAFVDRNEKGQWRTKLAPYQGKNPDNIVIAELVEKDPAFVRRKMVTEIY